MRVANWRDELLAVLDAAHGRKFRWGYHDCFQFIARCYAAQTGDEKRLLFPRYRTRSEAEGILEQFGGARGILTHALGEPVHCSRAGEGDIVLIDMGQGEQPALCRGLNSYAPGMRNLVLRPTLTASAAWIL
jgi:hypothetical protein